MSPPGPCAYFPPLCLALAWVLTACDTTLYVAFRGSLNTLRKIANISLQCDGTRPRCNRCNDNDLTCQYDVAEGVSRAERMKIMKRDSITGELEDLKRIITSLRSGTDDQAAAVLARLRLGESPEDVAKSLPMTVSPASGQPPRYAPLDYSLPLAQHINTHDQLIRSGVYRHVWKRNEP